MDDDRLILTTLSHALREAGFIPVEAATGSAALEICRQSPPDLAIFDYDMPESKGIQVAKTVSDQAQFPIIFLSAFGDDSIVRGAAEAGAMAYLVKPVDPPKLIPTIHTVLKRYAELRSLRLEAEQLAAALKGTRNISIVIGLLMERLHLTESAAYRRLRHYSRSHARKIADVATEILAATGHIN